MPQEKILIKPEDVSIDVKLAIEEYRKKHPELKDKTQKALALEIKTTMDTFVKWKKNPPKVIADLLNIAAICECEITDFVKKKN